jgi:hypothetical protein
MTPPDWLTSRKPRRRASIARRINSLTGASSTCAHSVSKSAAPRVPEQQREGRGYGRRRDTPANFAATPFEMSRLRPGGGCVPHDFVQCTFAETAAHRSAERVGHLLACKFVARPHSQHWRRRGAEQWVTCECQQQREGRLAGAVGVPATSHDPEQQGLRVQSVQLREPLTGELPCRCRALTQAVVVLDRCEVVVARGIRRAVAQYRL